MLHIYQTYCNFNQIQQKLMYDSQSLGVVKKTSDGIFSTILIF